MKRRNLLRAVLGIAVALSIVANVIVHPEHVPVLAPFKGKAWMGQGFVYAPYIPVIMTDPISDDLSKWPMTVYARRPVNSNYYGRISTSTI